jgi:hypothetical protein
MILVMSQIEKPSDNRLYAVEAGVIEPILVSLKCKVIAVGILRRLARGPWNGSFGGMKTRSGGWA